MLFDAFLLKLLWSNLVVTYASHAPVLFFIMVTTELADLALTSYLHLNCQHNAEFICTLGVVDIIPLAHHNDLEVFVRKSKHF